MIRIDKNQKNLKIYKTLCCEQVYITSKELDITNCDCPTIKRLKNIWKKIKERCYDKKFIYYNNYGGRGITVCSEWLEDKSAFIAWALLNGYRDDLEIDRIDNDEGYDPNNCRWVTRKENCNNRIRK